MTSGYCSISGLIRGALASLNEEEDMWEFVFGTDEQFADLKRKIQDVRETKDVIVFNDCVLPPCCHPSITRIAFGYKDETYRVLIDYGVRCSKIAGGIELTQFKQFLEAGEYRFFDFNDVKVFFHQLKSLY